ncbi:unnamed protein product [Parascedosporium putredinis]|uniref:NUC153 domain-containing protein n=1 Tax=Parascedosporium putredinis TaxID=1442378 RepID=A0A9P1M5Z6_9PEZI|nr:unnamed protein product [Parascedosporium putredinis]CAI7987835.1 unnamed protein product [Parascedosporium putredinis]
MGVAKKGRRSGGSSAPSRISDSRFASFETDPRFRLPSSKKTKTAIDKRFSHMLKSEDFISGAKVDRYGRKLKSDAGKKALQNLYRAEDEEEDNNSSGGEETKRAPGTESGDENDEEDADEDVEAVGAQNIEQKASKGRPYDPARDGGFSSSDSDSESDREEEAVEELDDNTAASMQRFADEQAQVEEGDVTKRIAIVNLDWDHIKSHDLMALFTSFLPAAGKGRIEKVSVYPSEFGKERMQREELEGPRIKQELLQEEDDKDFDSDALRAYQLDRLRYYYAVMVCSDPATAHTIYEATDGTEYLSSSNFIDLRFIPDDVTFDDEPRDECTSVLEGYEPVEFVTNALQSSKVKLTWDIHPEEAARKQSMQKAFSGSRADMQENDLRAYLASDTEDEAGSPDEGDEGLSKKELAKKKLREALGLGDESAAKSSKDGPVGDMEITFTSALMEGPKKVKKAEEEETTIERYARKERERKQRKKEQNVAKRNDAQSDGSADEAPADSTEDLGFNDPFFTTEEPAVSKSQIRKEDRLKKREAREAEEAENAASKAKLKRIMDDGAEEDGMKKRGKDDEDASANLQESKSLRLDDRFSSLFENHEYAIDTSNPSYTRTEALKKMLDDGRKRKTRERDDGAEPETSSKKNKKAKKEKHDNDVDLGSLVASVKQKAKKKSKV